MFVNGVDDLRPEIPTASVGLINTLVQLLNCNIGRLGPVLLDQLTRRIVYPAGHCLLSRLLARTEKSPKTREYSFR